MVSEVIEMFEPIGTGTIVDATFGGGGHTAALLEAFPGVEIVAFDRDPDAGVNAEALAGSGRFTFVAADFADLGPALAERGIGEVAGVLFDLGVSSHQLDAAERGFSYQHRGPLDMRMGPDALRSAAEIVNEWAEADLASVLSTYGEERFARRVARAIVAARPVRDTVELAEIVKHAIPAATRRTGGHPARRTFQALRIVVNEELKALEQGLDDALARLTPGGRCVVISYHSLEDRIVKRRFAAGAQQCTCPPELPVCVCDTVADLRVLTRKPLRPEPDEVERNPRARSARLRAAEKVAA